MQVGFKIIAVNPDLISPFGLYCGVCAIYIAHRDNNEKWIRDEEARYFCPECGNKVFRGAVKCNQCKGDLDLD